MRLSWLRRSRTFVARDHHQPPRRRLAADKPLSLLRSSEMLYRWRFPTNISLIRSYEHFLLASWLQRSRMFVARDHHQPFRRRLAADFSCRVFHTLRGEVDPTFYRFRFASPVAIKIAACSARSKPPKPVRIACPGISEK